EARAAERAQEPTRAVGRPAEISRSKQEEKRLTLRVVLYSKPRVGRMPLAAFSFLYLRFHRGALSLFKCIERGEAEVRKDSEDKNADDGENGRKSEHPHIKDTGEDENYRESSR